MYSAQKIQSATALAQSELAQSWPEILDFLPANTPSAGTDQATTGKGQTSNDFAKITQEERLLLLNQLSTTSALPPGQLDTAITQDIGMKLGYILKKSVSFSIEDQHLSFSHGSIQAVAPKPATELPLWPADPVSQQRAMTNPVQQQWGVSVFPRDLTTSARSIWSAPWFIQQRVLVINPVTLVAVVGQITDILTSRLHRYQFGGAPAVLKAGGFWAPGSHGRVVMCFLEENVPLGTVFDLRTY
jgi:hypothetical protein